MYSWKAKMVLFEVTRYPRSLKLKNTQITHRFSFSLLYFLLVVVVTLVPGTSTNDQPVPVTGDSGIPDLPNSPTSSPQAKPTNDYEEEVDDVSPAPENVLGAEYQESPVSETAPELEEPSAQTELVAPDQEGSDVPVSELPAEYASATPDENLDENMSSSTNDSILNPQNNSFTLPSNSSADARPGTIFSWAKPFLAAKYMSSLLVFYILLCLSLALKAKIPLVVR